MIMLGIFTVTYNIPVDVLLLQVEAIKKFCKDALYKIIVCDNSSDDAASNNIKYHAERLGLRYFRTKATSYNSSDSHAWAANFIYQRYFGAFHYYLFLDHDCIPVKDFCVSEILKDKVIAGIGQAKEKTYMWAGCLMFDQKKVGAVDLSPNSEYGLDTGGNTYKVIEEFGEDKCSFFNEEYHQNPNYNGRYNSYAMINDGMFLHFINGSNWNNEPDNATRINSLINITREMAGL